ncbi:hypothetical protein DEJ50_17010 [Streptomyces venezuelae]|uniref:Uncharacterized protein n=1 Tax=Streptomyces venezuelae TaxID=54571 RepID=A0A5P2D7K0_STRVZ|nr:hypothetical protein [Streptomyces venezuelae]QES49251.1 hypothetical protein DEJ50_17010 [Streptomyces venezuelae]
MPIDPYAALNAMIRAEAARFTPPPPKPAATDPDGPVAEAGGTASAGAPQRATAEAAAAPAD